MFANWQKQEASKNRNNFFIFIICRCKFKQIRSINSSVYTSYSSHFVKIHAVLYLRQPTS